MIKYLFPFLSASLLLVSSCQKDTPFGTTRTSAHPLPSPVRETVELGLTEVGIFASPTLSLLEGGFSASELFVFSHNDEKYVLKLLDFNHPDHSEKRRKKRLSEVQAQTLGSDLGIAPKLLWSDPEGRVMIMKYAEGHPLTVEDLKNPKVLQRLGKILKKLHGQPIPSQPLQQKTQLDRALKHYRQAVAKQLIFPSGFHEIFEKYCRDGEQFADVQTVCHADLHPGNILVHGEEVHLIDWANATIDHPYTDLGYLSLLSGMNSQQIDIFFDAYLGKPATGGEKKLLQQAKRRTYFLSAVVWFDFSHSPKTKNCSSSGKKRELDALLASPDLPSPDSYIFARTTPNPLTASPEEIRLFALSFLKAYLDNNRQNKR